MLQGVSVVYNRSYIHELLISAELCISQCGNFDHYTAVKMNDFASIIPLILDLKYKEYDLGVLSLTSLLDWNSCNPPFRRKIHVLEVVT